MSVISELMAKPSHKKRPNISGTVEPEMKAKFLAFVEAAKGVKGLQISGESSALDRILDVADCLGWLDDVDLFRRVYLAALAKADENPSKKKRD